MYTKCSHFYCSSFNLISTYIPYFIRYLWAGIDQISEQIIQTYKHEHDHEHRYRQRHGPRRTRTKQVFPGTGIEMPRWLISIALVKTSSCIYSCTVNARLVRRLTQWHNRRNLELAENLHGPQILNFKSDKQLNL